MKIHLLSLVVLSLLGTTLSAQTKKIAFESHSGDPKNFEMAMTLDLLDEGSDFGLPEPDDVKSYKLDSVIFVSETVTVLVTKEYSRLKTAPKDSSKFVRSSKDTVYNSKLFANRHSLDSIKAELKKQGYYLNSNKINKVIFIGFDNKKPVKVGAPVTQKRNIVLPVVSFEKPNKNSPFDSELVLMLGTIFLVSLLGGWISWKFYQPRLQ